MRPLIPVSKKNQEIVEVGGLYFLKKYGVTIGERTKLKSAEDKRQLVAVTVQQLIQKIAKQKNITLNAAQEILAPTGKGDTTVDNTDVLIEYAEDLAKISSSSSDIQINMDVTVATIMIQKRVVYPVRVTKAASFNDKTLYIEKSELMLTDKMSIRFGTAPNFVYAVVDANHQSNSDKIKVAPLAGNINEDSVGFVYDRNEQLIVGAEWSEEDTMNLDEELVKAIYDFYTGESTKWQEVELPTESRGENLEEPRFPELTGRKSTGESNLTE